MGKNSYVDASQSQTFNILSEKHLREAERANQKVQNLTDQLICITNDLDKAEQKYKVLTQKVAKVSEEHPVPGQENFNLAEIKALVQALDQKVDKKFDQEKSCILL